jgi:hypothetical protein
MEMWERVKQRFEDYRIVKLFYGDSGTGKTAAFHWITQECKDMKICLYKTPAHVLKGVPDYIKVIQNIREAEIGDTIFFDDIALFFLSRASTSGPNKEISSYLSICRQSKHNVILSIQSMALLDKNFFRTKGFTIIQKSTVDSLSTIMQDKEEWQPGLIKGYQKIKSRAIFPDYFKFYTYIHSENCLVRSGLAKYWTTTISEPFREWYRTETNSI